MDLPIENGDFPYLNVSFPEGISTKKCKYQVIQGLETANRHIARNGVAQGPKKNLARMLYPCACIYVTYGDYRSSHLHLFFCHHDRGSKSSKPTGVFFCKKSLDTPPVMVKCCCLKDWFQNLLNPNYLPSRSPEVWFQCKKWNGAIVMGFIITVIPLYP